MVEALTLSPNEIVGTPKSPLDEGSKDQIEIELESRFGTTELDIKENADHYNRKSEKILKEVVSDFKQYVDTEEARSVSLLENNLGALTKLLSEGSMSQLTHNIDSESLNENLEVMKVELLKDLETQTPKDTDEAVDMITEDKDRIFDTVDKASTDFAITEETRKNMWVREIEDLYEESIQLAHKTEGEDKEKVQRYSNKLGNLVDKVYTAHSTVSKLEQETYGKFSDSMMSLGDSLDIIPETVHQNLP